MKHIKTLAGVIDVFTECWEYSDNTIKLVESQCEDPERDLVNWQLAGYCDVLNLSRTFRKSPNPIVRKVFEDFRDILSESIGGYVQRYGIVEKLYSDSPYQLLKFSKGQHLPLTYDGRQTLTVLLAINEFEIMFPSQNIYIKFVPGTMAIFPSNFAYRFESKPVTDESQYVIMTFLKDGKDSN